MHLGTTNRGPKRTSELGPRPKNGLSRTGVGASHMKRSSDGTVSSDLHSPLQIEWTKQADAGLAKLERRVRQRVKSAVRQFADTGHGRIKRLGGFAARRFRLRVGEWRVLFRRETGAIHIHRVLHRREAHRKSSWIGHGLPVEEGIHALRDCERLPDPEDCELIPSAAPTKAQ